MIVRVGNLNGTTTDHIVEGDIYFQNKNIVFKTAEDSFNIDVSNIVLITKIKQNG